MKTKNPLPDPTQKPTPTWGAQRRLEFIDARLRWEGRLNRGDLMAFFGISVPQSSKDIALYRELAPLNLVYDPSERVYRAGPAFEAQFASSDACHYLSALLASQTGVPGAPSGLAGWLPPAALAPLPGRAIDADTLAMLARAVRESQSVRALYQSMSHEAPAYRTLTPHAFGHDGFRWHVRAYCHTRGQFRDFVIARIVEIAPCQASGPGHDQDLAWHTLVELVLAPNPNLSKGFRRAIALDYGMVNGQAAVVCRQALLFYTLKRLGLQAAPALDQQIVLVNRQEVEPYLRPDPQQSLRQPRIDGPR